MIGWLLSIVGIGGLGAALVFIPGLLPRVIAAVKGLIGIVAEYPWQVALAAALGLGAWCWQGWSRAEAQRAALAAWQADVTTAARQAAHRPKLAPRFVAQQVTYLGQALDRVETVQRAALASAQAAKAEQERRQRDNKRKSDDALSSQIADHRRRTADLLRPYRVHGRPGGSAALDHGGTRQPGADLPDPAFGTGQPDPADRGPGDLVTIPVAYTQACAAVTARLFNAQDWALEVLPKGD